MLTDDTLKTRVDYTPLDDDNNTAYDAYSYSQVGGFYIGSLRNNVNDVSWTLKFDLGQRRFYMQSNAGVSHNLATIPSSIQVTQVTFSFDDAANVVWAYSYIDTLTNTSHVYLGRFTPSNVPAVENIMIIDEATSPTLTLDMVRNAGVPKLQASVLLFYTPSNSSTMLVRQSFDDFLIERQLADLKDNEFIVKSGTTIGRRIKVETREVVGRTIYKTFLTAQGGLLLDSTGNPLWVSHPQRT